MNKEEKHELKNKYIEIISSYGYKIMYDMDSDLKDDMFDIYLLCTRVDKSVSVCQKKYVFLQIAYTSELSLSEFKEYLAKDEKELSLFKTGIKNRMIEFTVDDIVAVLLHNAFHLEEIYQFIQGKPRLKLNRNIIELLMHEFNMKGSPL